MFIPKVRIVENLLYSADINDNVDPLLEQFNKIIKEKPSRPNESNLSTREKFAHIFFSRKNYDQALTILRELEEEIIREFRAYKDLQSEKIAMLKNWEVWCLFL